MLLLENISEILSKEKLTVADTVSWAAYRASQVSPTSFQPANISLLPLFYENAHTATMILHAMNVVNSAVKHVNAPQVPVICFDQPLFALAKQIKWEMPQTHGENHFVIMFGGLHIEMALYKALGKWLDGSGWTDVLVDAQVATPGVSDSFKSASHLTRTRHAHQVTAAALYVLEQQAYTKYVVTTPGQPKEINAWREEMSKIPQFLYWTRVLDLQRLCLQFVRGLREGNLTCMFKL